MRTRRRLLAHATGLGWLLPLAMALEVGAAQAIEVVRGSQVDAPSQADVQVIRGARIGGPVPAAEPEAPAESEAPPEPERETREVVRIEPLVIVLPPRRGIYHSVLSHQKHTSLRTAPHHRSRSDRSLHDHWGRSTMRARPRHRRLAAGRMTSHSVPRGKKNRPRQR
jgi:hypothetical protein